MMTDPIADMLTRIRNSIMIKQEKVNIPFSKIKKQIAIILKDEGLINNFKIVRIDDRYMLRVYLKYAEGSESVIRGLKRISKPGCRVYVSKDDIPVVMNGLGIALLSTSKGLLTDRRCRNIGVGGEVICHVW